MDLVLRLLAGLLGLAVIVLGLRHAARLSARARLATPDEQELTVSRAGEPGALEGWLSRAGLRGPRVVSRMWFAALVFVVLGVLFALLLAALDVGATLGAWTAGVPGGFGDAFLPVLLAAPWLVFLLVASLPWMWVRRERRRRLQLIERDLPVVLELLATLGEAGFGLDAGLQRVLAVQDPRRPLSVELRQFQQDALAGIPRVAALRRLARRVELTSMSILVSALLQAEQVGAALAETLRSQAQDLWSRRREDALTQAQALPAKLAFPLVLCFLPALFVITLGPILVDFLQLAESVLAGST